MPGVKRQGSAAKNRRSKKRSRGTMTVVRSKPATFPYRMNQWRAGTIGLSLPLNAPVSRILKTKLVYFEKASLNPTAGGLAADHVWRLNSLYDPSLTTVGHQPAGFDELMTLYKYYAVESAQAHITFQSADDTYEALCCAHVNTLSTALTDCQPAIENGRTNFMVLSRRGGSRDVLDMKLSISIPQETSTRDVMDNQELWGTQSLDPTNVVYLHTSVQPNGTGDAGVVGLYVAITYTAYFFEPRTVASS